jgi:hypothetical protein
VLIQTHVQLFDEIASMTIRTAPLLTLSLLTLLGTTSLASAGFVWLSPDDKPVASDMTYTPSAEPADAQAKTDGRNWKIEETAPVPLAPVVSAPVVAAPAETTALQSMGEASQQVQTILEPSTMAASPVVAPAEPVVLAASSNLSSVETATGGTSMPTAQAMIDSMPSMTAPRSDLTPSMTAFPKAEGTAPIAPPVSPAEPVMAASAPVVMAPATAPADASVSPITGATLAPETMPVASVGTVQGFGKQVPLVVALRQLMPQGYTFVRGEGVDLSQSVDWQGGKVWNEVLADAIRPHGLSATLSGDTVVLARDGAPAPVVATGARPTLGNATMMGSPVN